MGTLEHIVCFESEAVLRLYESAYPDASTETWLSCDALLAQVLPAPPESRAVFESLLTEDERPQLDSLWHTVRALREAPILSHEDVDFAFGSLPETPRHRRLRSLLHRYLDSELGFDRVARLNLLIERLRSGDVDAPAPRLVFVRDRDPRPLFEELAKAFANAPGAQSTHLAETWEWSPLGETAGKRRGIIVSGGAAQSVEAFADRAAAWIARGNDPSSLRMYFGGSESDLALLRLMLAARAMAPEDFVAQKGIPLAGVLNRAGLITALRADKSRELRDRLRLTSLLSTDRIDPRAAIDEATIETFSAKIALSDADVTYLKALASAPPPARERAHSARRALLLPLHPLARDARTLSLTFAGRDALRATPDPLLLLKEGEKETLLRAGFSLPRVQAARERGLARLAALLAPAHGRATLFTELAPAELPPSRLVRLARKAREHARSAAMRVESPTTTLSATQLEAYARCPAQYFFAHRLRLRPRESREERFALLFGQLAHRTLESCFRTNPDDSSPERLNREFERLIGEDPELRLPASDPLSIMLREQFERTAKRVPAVEAQKKRLFGSFTPLDFERDFSIDIDGVKIRGKIDRVDQAPDGSVLVIDYKTGNVDFTPEHIRRGEHFQALLYLAAAEKLYSGPCLGVVFYDLKKGEIKRGWIVEERAGTEVKKGMTRGHAMPAEKFEGLRADGLAQLRQLVASMDAGDFAPRPDAETCSRCQYGVFCRSNPEVD